jgi:intracellular multiplication protein IcmL
MSASGQIEQAEKKAEAVAAALAAYAGKTGNAQDAGGLFSLLALVRLLSVAIILLTGALWYVVDRGRPDDRYFAMSFDYRTMGMVPINSPNLNLNAMLGWVDLAVTQVMTFGFNDINEQFGVSRQYFTDVGWESFFSALNSSQLLRDMFKNQQMMTAILSGPPTVLYSGFRKGEYVWDIQVPIVLTVRAGGVSKSAMPRLVVTIMRVPTAKNPIGLGIHQWIMS